MIVVIAGMYRSGSTFTFNVVKNLLERTGKVTQIADNSIEKVLQMHKEDEHLIIKSHAPDAGLTDLIRKSECLCVCSYRKPEDAIASWARVFGGEMMQINGIFEAWLQWHSTVSDQVENIAYDDIETDSIGVILQLQRYICGSLDIDLAREIDRKLAKAELKAFYDQLERGDGKTDIGFTYYDNETFFHRRHISSIEPIRAIDELPAVMVDDIRKRLAPYCDASGDYWPGSDAANGSRNSRG